MEMLTLAFYVPGRQTWILQEVFHPGFASKPMQRPDVGHKFRGNIGKRWPRQKTDAVLQSLWVLEDTHSIGALLATLTV